MFKNHFIELNLQFGVLLALDSLLIIFNIPMKHFCFMLIRVCFLSPGLVKRFPIECFTTKALFDRREATSRLAIFKLYKFIKKSKTLYLAIKCTNPESYHLVQLTFYILHTLFWKTLVNKNTFF